MIKVLSVDDHALLREGIAALVNAESGHEGWLRNGFRLQNELRLWEIRSGRTI
jgi:hypothetical protein